MSLQVGELYAKLELDKKPFTGGLDDAERHAKGWASRVGGGIANVGANLLKFGAIAGGVAAGGMFFLGNKASDLNETMSKVTVVFGENADAIKNWADDAALNFGMSKNVAAGAAATFGNLFVSMGIGAGPTKDMSKNLVELAGDLASFNNMNPEEVLEKLRSGLVGETEPLRSLGVNINQAVLEAKAMELGLWDGVGAIDAAAKSQAAYAIILDQTKTAQGDFARTSGGMANQQRIVAATFGDTMAAVGQAFTPLFEMILPLVTDALGDFQAWVTNNMPAIKEVVTNVMAGIGSAISFLFTEILPRLIEVIGWVVENVFPLFAAGANSIGNDILPALSAAFAVIIDNVLPALIAVFEAVMAWVSDNWPTISSVVQQALEAISNAVKVVWPIVEAIAKVLFPLIGTAASILLKALDGTFKLIGGVFEVAGNVVTTVVDTITGAWDVLSTATGRIWDGIANTIKGAINIVIGIINGFIGFINGVQIHIPEIGVGPVHTPAFDWWGLKLPKIPYLAAGVKDFAGGWAVVGERGPELAQFPPGTNVFPNGTNPLGSSKVEVILRDPDHALPSSVSARDVAALLEEALSTSGFVRQLRHSAVRP